jgi:homoserine O-acetyltransferase
MVVRAIQSDPAWNRGGYTQQPRGLIDSYYILRLMFDGIPHFEAIAPDKATADRFMDSVDKQAEARDANDVLYAIQSSLDYDPEPGLEKIRAKVYGLGFDDDEFNPARLGVLEKLIKRVPEGRYAIQAGSESTHGHLTMAFPSLWVEHVAAFVKLLNRAAPAAP